MEQYEQRPSWPAVSEKSQRLITIEVAWRAYIGWQEIPSLKFRCSWLAATGGDVNKIIALIEEASQRNDIQDPSYWIWRELRRNDVRNAQRDKSVRVLRTAA